jgi:hypothetical protein
MNVPQSKGPTPTRLFSVAFIDLRLANATSREGGCPDSCLPLVGLGSLAKQTAIVPGTVPKANRLQSRCHLTESSRCP